MRQTVNIGVKRKKDRRHGREKERRYGLRYPLKCRIGKREVIRKEGKRVGS